MYIIVPTLFDNLLSDIDTALNTVSEKGASQLFTFFQQHPLFNWKDNNNGCEGRADAVCVLLEAWAVTNYKAWVFGGAYLKKNHIGELHQNWKYHVAPVLPVMKNGRIVYYVIDPATANSLQPVEEWAAAVTKLPHSYYCIRQAHWYIFPAANISTANWNSRNRQNRKWMIQCLAGINGLTATGKARLSFDKARIKKTAAVFEKMKKENPSFAK